MKKTLTFLSLVACGVLFVTAFSQAQIMTGRGDFFNITRTAEQTADSVTFVADTLTVYDSGSGLTNFQNGDSVAITFVQNRFRVVNNMIGTTQFDYVRVQVSNTATMRLSRQAYTGVVTNTTGGFPVLGTDPGQTGTKVGLRPVYRPVGAIASSSVFNSDPSAIRQFLTTQVLTPGAGSDGIQIRNIHFKPNINNLTGLALPPDTTKDTLRAYLLDGTGIAAGNVMSQTDLAIVRLLPGTTRILMWVKDSAQAIDAGEYFGSFGDYSRGRYFLGDDGLPMADSRTLQFRPGITNANWGPGAGNPDYGLVIDGFPPERNPIRLSTLYQTLAPFWYNNNFPSTYPVLATDPCANPNPESGLIPPYRVGEYAVAHNPYQPGLVTSALDTLRFYDEWGNRTWDRVTQPVLSALGYDQNTSAIGTPLERTVYLKGYTEASDTLRQFGQIVYRRLTYVAADMETNAGGVADSVRILATAKVKYRGLGHIPAELDAIPDTSGGFPRTWNFAGTTIRTDEALMDSEMPRATYSWVIDEERTPVDPAGVNSLPNTGVKITVRPNIPRAIEVQADDQWKDRGILENRNLRLHILIADGYGNTVDDNEWFKYELSSFGRTTAGQKYRLGGVFDSLVQDVPNVQLDGGRIDTGRVAAVSGATVLGTANNHVFRPATGANNIGWYRIRVRSSYSFPDRGGSGDLHAPLKFDPFPNGSPQSIFGFSHVGWIPDGSPNNTFGPIFSDGTVAGGCPTVDAGFGRPMAQTTAIDSIDVHWNGTDWFIPFKGQRWPRLEVVCGKDDAFVVGRVGTYTPPGQPQNIYTKLYLRLVDIHNNPMDIDPYFHESGNKDSSFVFVELPDNRLPDAYAGQGTNIDKYFIASVSENIAESGPGGIDNPTNIEQRFQPLDPVTGDPLLAELVHVPVGQTLPGLADQELPAPLAYNAVRFYIRAPENVRKLSLAGVDVVPIRAYLYLKPHPDAEGIAVQSGICYINVVPDVVATVEVFKSTGKPQGTTVPLEGWGPGSPDDAAADYYPTATPRNPSETNEFYKGYFFRTAQPAPPSTDATFPAAISAGAEIGGFYADDVEPYGDATCPIPMDTLVVSEHSEQVRIVARLLDQYRNPIGGRLVKFHVESLTLPVTPPATVLQNNAQRGGFGEFSSVNIFDDTLKRSTIGDTAQAGWVSAFFVSGRVAHQFVRIAITPDTMAYDLSDVGRNLGEGTVVGPSFRGFAPRVIVPIYQKPDTTVRVEILPYTAAVTSPVPLPVDLVSHAAIEDPYAYFTGAEASGYAPRFRAWSSNPFLLDERATHFGRMANTNIRPYLPDTLNLASNDPNDVNAVTAGRIVTLLVREYDKFGNLKESATDAEDTARIRFRMWGANFGAPSSPYSGAGPGTIAPAMEWTRDEYGPMRKLRFRHTQISNLVAGVHINQTAFLTALEFPTPKTSASTHYFEATASAVLPGSGIVDLDRDTCKVVTIMRNPTRFDILRAGMEFPGSGSPGVRPLTGDPEARGIDLLAPPNIALPPGSDPINHNFEAQGVDNILVSQVYRRNVSTKRVGKYEIVNEDGVPLDQDGDPLYATADATTINPDFNIDEHTGKPQLVKLDAYNNQNAFNSPFYNSLNLALPGFAMPTGYRNDGVVFDVHMAGGGDEIGTNINTPLDMVAGVDTWPNTNPLNPGNPGVTPLGGLDPLRSDRRAILLRITPVWENTNPSNGDENSWIEPSDFVGTNAQPGQTRTYTTRLYSDSIYVYSPSFGGTKMNTARGELMGTRTDRGLPGKFSVSDPTNNTDFDRITRFGVRTWSRLDFNRAGFPVDQFAGTGRSNGNAGIASGSLFPTDWNRRYFFLANAFGTGAFPGYIAPGMFIALVDSTTEQVVDLRVIDPSLSDRLGNPVDDTTSYDQGKWMITRRAPRMAASLWQYDDTFVDGGNPDGIMGPNFSALLVAENPVSNVNSGRPRIVGNPGAARAGLTASFLGPIGTSPRKHTFVVIPYRTAYMSVFPSSFDISQGTNLVDKLPLGILPGQADIDTIPRINIVPPLGSDMRTYELFTRTYGQVVHGITDELPHSNPTVSTASRPYARPDTIFRDQLYTYAITPYDRYGNVNTRDSMFVTIGARFSATQWEFLNNGGTGNFLLVRSGGDYFTVIPRNTPTNEDYRRDTLRIFNPIATSNVNRYLGIKPDDKRLGITIGEPGGVAVPDGLLPANIIASRPVSVKLPFRPADFTISDPALNYKELFRMDHVGGCDSAGLEMDTLTLAWQKSEWTNQPGRNNPNDTIKYEWIAIIDSVSGVTGDGHPMIISRLAEDLGRKPYIKIPGDELRDLIFRPNVMPQPNQDSLVMRLKWYVRAYSKTGLEAFSDTAGVTVRQNPYLPVPALIVSINRAPQTPPTPNTPGDGDVVRDIDINSLVDITWNPSTDINIDKGHLIGGFETFDPISQTWRTILNSGTGLGERTVDTLTYQWVGVVTRTFPVGKGASIGTAIVRNTGATNGFQLTGTDLEALFAGFDTDPTSASADSVCLKWWAIAKDYNFDNVEITFPYSMTDDIFFTDTTMTGEEKAVRADSGMFSWTACEPHWIKGGPYTVCFTRLGTGGVEIDPNSTNATGTIQKIVGEEVCFTLTAKDDKGQIIRNWDEIGDDITDIIIHGSNANTDTSDVSWNSDPEGYTFAVVKDGVTGQVLTQIDSVTFGIPKDAFVNGVATICFVHTKALNGVSLQIAPTTSGLEQDSPLMDFTADQITNYLVDLTPSTSDPNQVYKFRKYEVVVTPRDRFMNTSNNQIKTLFTARFPGEFVDSRPDLSNIFSGEVFVNGVTNYFLASTTMRAKNSVSPQLQTIEAYSANDPAIRGICDPYEILDHAPEQFALLDPPDHSILHLTSTKVQEAFDWEVADDPYTDIPISRYTNERGNDIVTYEIVFVDSLSRTQRFDVASDDLGLKDTYTTTHGQLAAVVDAISGGNTVEQNVIWFVEATDGLYTTSSTPGLPDVNNPGHYLFLDLSTIISVPGVPTPTEFALEQNYPNPFNPSTSINYSVPTTGQVNIVIYDLLGNVVKTLVNDVQKPGQYKIAWNATNDEGTVVPTGNYILKMIAGDFVQTRKMTLLK